MARTHRRILITAKKPINRGDVAILQDQQISCLVFDFPGTYEMCLKHGSLIYDSHQEACEDFKIMDWYYE